MGVTILKSVLVPSSSGMLVKPTNLLVPQFPDLWDEVRTDLPHRGLRIWPSKC